MPSAPPQQQQQPRPLTLATAPQIDQELVLLSVLKEPVSRSIFDYALRSRDIASLFRHLLLRQKKRTGSIPECPAPDDPAITQMLKKLLSQVSQKHHRTVTLTLSFHSVSVEIKSGFYFFSFNCKVDAAAVPLMARGGSDAPRAS